jgi:hypothetical protein
MAFPRRFAAASLRRSFATPAPSAGGASSLRTGPPSPSQVRRVAVSSAVFFGLTGAYLAGCFYPFDMAHLLAPRTAPAPHHRESVGGRVYTRQLEAALHELPIVQELKAKDGWYATRPYTKLEPQKAQHSLTGGALRGPGMLAVPPMVFAREDESEAVVIVHLGRSMCGHDGIVHGGMVGVVLDEATGRNVSRLVACTCCSTRRLTNMLRSRLALFAGPAQPPDQHRRHWYVIPLHSSTDILAASPVCLRSTPRRPATTNTRSGLCPSPPPPLQPTLTSTTACRRGPTSGL